jgi:NADH-quinone oxidoreductase subunit M
MILLWLIVWILAAGILAWIAGRWGTLWPRWISVIALVIHLAGLIAIWAQYPGTIGLTGGGPWLVELNLPWFPQVGISFYLAIDGLSLLLIILANFLTLAGVVASWDAVQFRVGFFHFSLLWTLAAITGVFLALDLFLFYFFWEMMLIPLYFLIGIWGYERRTYAALKFFIFTQLSGLLMLLGILALYFVHGRTTGVFTFSYTELLGTSMAPALAFWLMLGFFAAFAVKLPLVPVHTWLPDAHTQAPTAGSVDLAGLVLKVGAYGFLRFLIPLFPQAALGFAPVAMALGVAGILYAAIVAFSQHDVKRLVAYTSVSHMGFVILGIFAWNQLALQGAVVIMIAHGISTGALFILAGILHDRLETRDLRRLGGLWANMPRTGGMMLLFTLLLGTYRVSPVLAGFAAAGFIVSTVYGLWMMQHTFYGPKKEESGPRDAAVREIILLAALAVVILWLGLYPQPVLSTLSSSLENLQQYTASAQAVVSLEGLQIDWSRLQDLKDALAQLREGGNP